jgi:hypothetical protein
MLNVLPREVSVYRQHIGVISGPGPILPANYIIVVVGKNAPTPLVMMAPMITLKACREGFSPLISTLF